MSNLQTIELTSLSSRPHFAHAYPKKAEQVVHITPSNLSQFTYAKLDNGLSITFYSLTFSAELLQQALTRVGQVKCIQLINAPDNGEDVAVSFLLDAAVSDETWQSVKFWARDNQIDVWQLSERPSLLEPGLLLMDMDSTTIKIECIDEIAKLAGVGEEVAAVTELAMQGKLDFAESLRGRVGTLKDADESIIAQVKDNLPLMHGLERLISVLKQANWRVAIASGGFTYFADKLKDDLGLDAAVANTLEVVDGKLTGQVLGGIVDAQVKADTLGELATQFDIPASQTVAMGDGANDLVMMAASSLGVAFEAKPLVQDKADVAVNFHGLDALAFILAR